MIFESKKLTPKIGDKKTVRKFAWLPTRVGDFIVWLEHYQIDYRYKNMTDPCSVFPIEIPMWVESKRYINKGVPLNENPPPPPTEKEIDLAIAKQKILNQRKQAGEKRKHDCRLFAEDESCFLFVQDKKQETTACNTCLHNPQYADLFKAQPQFAWPEIVDLKASSDRYENSFPKPQTKYICSKYRKRTDCDIHNKMVDACKCCVYNILE